ncbi:DUF3658 domain-containing protein [Gynuella sp.]|uniref:DUF3658 domain-containing protein n=1 Tax=Gynuella sp. TaxID=2969146 RepID=UPI003D0F9242
MNDSEFPFDSELTQEQLELISKLSDSAIEEIDAVLLAQVGKQPQKVAMVVAMAMSKLSNKIEGIPDIFYAQRVAEMVNKGLLLSQGNLRRMRHSEVKVP